MFLDTLDQTFLEFGIMHGQDGLLSVQIDLQVRAFAGSEDRSLLREPTLNSLLVTLFIVNNIVYIGNLGLPSALPAHAASTEMPCRVGGGAGW